MTTFEDEHVDVFHNLEGAIVKMYQFEPNLIDAQVDTALDHLIRVYNAEAQGKTAPRKSIRGAAVKIADQLEPLCEFHLGRLAVEDLEDKPLNAKIPQRDAAEMTACLKRIKSSLKLWSKKGGRQGYLNFVTDFIQDTLRN